LVQPDAQEAVIARGAREEETGFASRREVRILTKNHEERWLEIIAAKIDFDGVPAKLFSAFDLTNRKRAEPQARLLAITDPITGLGNYGRILARRPPCGDGKIEAHATAVCCSAAGLGWAEEYQ